MKTLIILLALTASVSGCVTYNAQPESKGCPQGQVQPDGRCEGPLKSLSADPS